MTRGIVLLALGDPAFHYAEMAVNMAVSLRYFNPEISIALVHDNVAIKRLSDKEKALFDVLFVMDKSDFTTNEKLSPGKAKINLYNYLPFNENIYLDCDGFCISPIDVLWQKFTKDWHAQTVGHYTNKDKEWQCQWMSLANVKKHFELPEKFILPEINSSFQFIRKNKNTEKVYYNAISNYETCQSIDKLDFGKRWGNTIPDELPMNIAFAQSKFSPCFKEHESKRGHWDKGGPIFFRTYYESGRANKLEDLQKEYQFIGVFGDLNFNHSSIVVGNGGQGYYDKVLNQCWQGVMGDNLPYKASRVLNNKHVKRR